MLPQEVDWLPKRGEGPNVALVALVAVPSYKLQYLVKLLLMLAQVKFVALFALFAAPSDNLRYSVKLLLEQVEAKFVALFALFAVGFHIMQNS